jgi:hypothetical protein
MVREAVAADAEAEEAEASEETVTEDAMDPQETETDHPDVEEVTEREDPLVMDPLANPLSDLLNISCKTDRFDRAYSPWA